MTTNGKAVNWEMVTENKAKPEDPLWFIKSPGKALEPDYQTAIDLALTKGEMIRAAEANFGNAEIEQRREGVLRRKNADDEQRIDVAKANHDRKILSGEDLNELIQLAAAAQECVLNYVEYEEKRNAARPLSVQPLGEALIKASVQVITRKYIEQLKLNAETGNQEIILATKPGQRKR